MYTQSKFDDIFYRFIWKWSSRLTWSLKIVKMYIGYIIGIYLLPNSSNFEHTNSKSLNPRYFEFWKKMSTSLYYLYIIYYKNNNIN